MPLILGVDPGLDGAIAWLHPGEASPGAQVMHVVGKSPDVHEIVRVLRDLGPALVVMEKAEAMPGQSVVSVARAFENYGLLRGVFEGRMVPLHLVRSSVWKRAMGVTSDKASSVELCQRLFPTADILPSERSRRPHDGMAEALLLAEWGRRNVLLGADERAGGGS